MVQQMVVGKSRHGPRHSLSYIPMINHSHGLPIDLVKLVTIYKAFQLPLFHGYARIEIVSIHEMHGVALIPIWLYDISFWGRVFRERYCSTGYLIGDCFGVLKMQSNDSWLRFVGTMWLVAILSICVVVRDSMYVIHTATAPSNFCFGRLKASFYGHRLFDRLGRMGECHPHEKGHRCHCHQLGREASAR